MKLPPIYDADDGVREQWKQNGGAGSTDCDYGAPVVLQAMKGGYCKVCHDMLEKDDWLQEKFYCSKTCRNLRNTSYYYKLMQEEQKQIEANAKEEPLLVRAWHIPLEVMCTVAAIDYAADRLYVTMPSKKDYAFNASIKEFLLQANVGKFRDVNAVPLMEGDVIAFEHEGTTKFYALGFDKQAGTLVAREHMVQGGLAFVMNEEAASKSTVVGNAFTFVSGGVVATKEEEEISTPEEVEAAAA